MPSSDMVKDWRSRVARKKRKIISFEETVQLKIASLKRWIYSDREPLHDWEVRHFLYGADRSRKPVDAGWKTIKVGETWGGDGMSAWFRRTVRVPERFAGKPVDLGIYLGGDSLLSVNGVPHHGLDPFRDAVPLLRPARGGEELTLEIEAYVSWHSNEPAVKTFQCAYLGVPDAVIHEAY